MTQSRAKTTTLVRWPSHRNPSHQIEVLQTVQYLTILALLCVLSAVSALNDPLAFAQMFGQA